MRHFITALSVFLCMSAVGAGCTGTLSKDSSENETRSIDVGQVNEIETSVVNVVLTPGRGSGVAQLTGPSDILDKVKINTRKGKLSIGFDNIRKNVEGEVTLVITADVHAVDALLGADVTFTAPVSISRTFDIEAGNRSSVTIPSLAATQVNIESYNKGNVTIECLESESSIGVEAYTAGCVNIGKAYALNADVEVYTAGKVFVTSGTIGTADLDVETGGHVNIKADVSILNRNTATGGSISVN